MRTTIKSFLDENFLLDNKMAETLYHNYAKIQPIIDYHNHLPADEITENRQFENLTAVWLNGDHYKWRAMRTLGIAEKYITGSASDKEKFMKWAETVPYTLRNPLFHWTHLELKRYFGINTLLSADTAEQIYHECNERLQSKEYSVQGLLAKMKVETVCTTDDPTDTLEHHQAHLENNCSTQLFPAFRPDKSILIKNSDFVAYIRSLERATHLSISNFGDLVNALQDRVDYFHDNGCRISDHGLPKVYAKKARPKALDEIFSKRMAGHFIKEEEANQYMSALLLALGRMYAEKNWVMQLHLGPIRNNSSRMMKLLGPDMGFDSIGDFAQAKDLSLFLNRLDSTHQLPKTILYNLNPSANEVMASMIGNFNDGSVRAKMQWGSAWWFLDQKDGIEKQLNTLSNMGLLSCFIGMLTDSRSFLSFPRHEYFRRILCNLIGRDVHNGELPNDEKWLGKIVEDICYHNAKNYFEW
ncbi:MAG: glucuronate isomerase [Saprospiraceae bacterium]|nr:glucuronate isomerase [Saprospiraceae bacterium]